MCEEEFRRASIVTGLGQLNSPCCQNQYQSSLYFIIISVDISLSLVLREDGGL